MGRRIAVAGDRSPVLLLARELGIGGTERQLCATASAISRSPRFDVHVGCFNEGFRTEELSSLGIPVVRFPVTSFRNRSAIEGARLMGQYIRQHGIQLVHTFDVPLNIFGVPVARMFRTPVVLSSQRSHRELSGRYRQALRITDRLVNGIVVNCDSVKQQLIEEDRVSPSRIHLCYNGIDTTTFRTIERERRDLLTVGVVCALRPEKDLPTLMKAFASAYNKERNLRLQLVGDGPELADLRQLASELQIGDVCAFEKTTNLVASWLHKMDIFVLPSRSEALSNSLMEAMACGCCSLASDVGGNRELIQNEATGLLFPVGHAQKLADAILNVVRNAEWRKTMASNAASLIQSKFPMERCSARMEEIYSSFLDKKNKKTG